MDKLQQTQERNNTIKLLDKFILNSKDFLSGIVNELGWNEQSTVFKKHEKPLVVCPNNNEHRVGREKLEQHLKKCCWHQAGYTDYCVPLPEAHGSCASTTVVFDKTLQAEVIQKAKAEDPTIQISDNLMERDLPQTSDRVFSDFTTDERRVLYDFVVSRTSSQVPRLHEFFLPNWEEGKREPLTKEQLMAAERDAKRRRVRYRSAKVHTKSKNYSEVMQEVISNQMMAYEDWLREENEVKEPSGTLVEKARGDEVTSSGSQEMVWLDWDYRSNPHVRWRYILEQEKRREKQKGAQSNDRTNDRENYKRMSKESYDSRKNSYHSGSREQYHRDDYDRHKGKHEQKERRRENKTDKYRERNFDSSRKRRAEREYDDLYKHYKKDSKYSREKNDYDGGPKQRKGSDYERDIKFNVSKDTLNRKYKHVTSHGLRSDHEPYNQDFHSNEIKGEVLEQFDIPLLPVYADDTKQNEYKISSRHSNNDVDSDSDDSSEELSSHSSHSKKRYKRKKKSKKKHKKKHNKKHKSKHHRKESTSS